MVVSFNIIGSTALFFPFFQVDEITLTRQTLQAIIICFLTSLASGFTNIKLVICKLNYPYTCLAQILLFLFIYVSRWWKELQLNTVYKLQNAYIIESKPYRHICVFVQELGVQCRLVHTHEKQRNVKLICYIIARSSKPRHYAIRQRSATEDHTQCSQLRNCYVSFQNGMGNITKREVEQGCRDEIMCV